LGRGYDNQQRITIPGHSEYGALCGFIGRTPIEATPKYLYTPGYPKSFTLFNLHRAKKHGDNGIIVVEGSLDVMRIHDLGYPNVTGILGSSLSVAQQKLLIKYTDKVYFMFDNDAAGLKANMQAIEAMKNQLNTYYISLGKLKDPGDIRDKATLDYLVSHAKDWNAFMFNKDLQKGVSTWQ
jgi:DNA primase